MYACTLPMLHHPSKPICTVLYTLTTPGFRQSARALVDKPNMIYKCTMLWHMYVRILILRTQLSLSRGVDQLGLRFVPRLLAIPPESLK